jgi:uncharacterized protein (TIGR02145 family)
MVGDGYEYWKLKGISGVRTPNYGVLYNWYAATDSRGIAPSGWHIPSNTEFATLITYLGGAAIAGGKLKEAGTEHWNDPNTDATDLYNFMARGGGFRDEDGLFYELKETLYLVAIYYNLTNSACAYDLTHDSAAISLDWHDENRRGQSIRYIKDDSTDPGTVSDYDGNVYPTVKIGDQVWMASNLMVEHFNNGDEIKNITDNAAWSALTTAGMCYYDNNVNNGYTEAVAAEILVNSHNLVKFKDTETLKWRINKISDNEVEILVDGMVKAGDIPALQVQSDWEQSDSGEPDYIKNKPLLGTISPKDYWTGSQSAYDALGSYDSNTIYFVEE